MGALPEMMVFKDVPVVPVTGQAYYHIARGGPIWPDFDAQVSARHCRAGVPVDRRPADPRPADLRRARVLRRPAVWGGFLVPQFGHLLAEQLPRLPQSLRDRPDDLYLFTVPVGETAESLPDYIWDVLGWYGLRRSKVRIIETCIVSSELRVAAPGEMLGNWPVAPEYIALLNTLTARNALPVVPADVLFVTRVGMAAQGRGAHLGEGYLADVVTRLGLRVLDPGATALRDQLAAYAGAKVIVFAEGSALFGRGLLGRIEQDIHVLRRRPTRNIAKNQITPRCRHLAYHATAARQLDARMDGGPVRADLCAAIYDLPVLFACFAALGVDLASAWDDAAYRSAVCADALGWLQNCPTDAHQMSLNIATLVAAGFDLGASTRALAAPFTVNTDP